MLMQGALRKSAARMLPAGTKATATLAGTLRFFCLLWLAGLAMRMTLLVVPPVIPLIHEDLRMSETQIGLLIGLPLALFAIAAVPGSLLVARGGAKLAVTLGMVIAAVAGGLRGAAFDVWTLYAAAIATGFGIAIMQPGMPKLVHDWLPNRIGIATWSIRTAWSSARSCRRCSPFRLSCRWSAAVGGLTSLSGLRRPF
jgi:CP family cyanate transporter-like MFS transporter